jgi:hypothetical protein
MEMDGNVTNSVSWLHKIHKNENVQINQFKTKSKFSDGHKVLFAKIKCPKCEKLLKRGLPIKTG